MRYATSFVLLALVLTTGCGGGGPDAVINESVSVSEEIHAILKNVKDSDSAKAAVEKVEALGQRLKGLKTKLQTMVKENPKEFMKYLDDMVTKLGAVMPKIQEEITRIKNDPKLKAYLQEALDKLK